MDVQQDIERLQKQVEALKSENALVWSRCADHGHGGGDARLLIGAARLTTIPASAAPHLCAAPGCR